MLRQHADGDVGVVPEYDLGERFDLKAKYADKGWVDEDAEFGKQACSLRQCDAHLALPLLMSCGCVRCLVVPAVPDTTLVLKASIL